MRTKNLRYPNESPEHQRSLRQIRKRTDVEWGRLIARLPEHERPQIASLVWWDFYGDNLVPNRTTVFDKWMSQFQLNEPLISNERLKEILEFLSYPELYIRSKLKFKPAAFNPSEIGGYRMHRNGRTRY